MEESKQACIVACAFAALVGAITGLATGPLGSSILVDLGILFYAVLLTLAPPLRYVSLAMAAGVHVAAVLAYYSNPIPLPLFIVERSANGYALDLDLVQAVILYELIFEYRRQGEGKP